MTFMEKKPYSLKSKKKNAFAFVFYQITRQRQMETFEHLRPLPVLANEI